MNDNKGIKVQEELTSDGQPSGVEKDIEDEEEITEPFNPSDIDIKTKPSVVSLIVDRIGHGEIDLFPDFQRKIGIWRLPQKSRLIESLLLRIPLPVFYVAANEDNDWLIVDGLQRLDTLYGFIKKESFALQNLEFLNQFDGLKFSQLPRMMQRRILEAELVIHITQPGSPKDVTRAIFKRINTGGLILSPQEIRHALYQGAATKLLKDLAETTEFKSATQYSIKDDRMLDREFVLRFLAFTINPLEQYTVKDLDGFLSKTMEKVNNAPSNKIEELRKKFLQAMKAAKEIFQDKAFRKQYRAYEYRYPINKALFETWSVSLGNLRKKEIEILGSIKDTVNNKFIDLMNGQYLPSQLKNIKKITFEQTITQETSAVNKVHFRFKAIKGLIQDVLGDQSS